jgi:hypothetical protein
LAIPFLAGCPGSLDPVFLAAPGGVMGAGGTGAVPAATCDAPALYFRATDATGCGVPGVCHDPAGAAFSKLNLVDANPWQRLLNQPAMSVGGPACMGMLLVDGANRANSVILKRVGGDTCGTDTLMPQGVASPQKDAVDCITAWVMSAQ